MISASFLTEVLQPQNVSSNSVYVASSKPGITAFLVGYRAVGFELLDKLHDINVLYISPGCLSLNIAAVV